MLLDAKTGEMNSLVQFVAEATDGFGQIYDPSTAQVVVNRLLAEHQLTPSQMLIRIMGAPVNLCADLFIKLADCYEGSGDSELWAEFGKAAGEIYVRDFIVRGMDDSAFPIIRRALGIDKEDIIN